MSLYDNADKLRSEFVSLARSHPEVITIPEALLSFAEDTGIFMAGWRKMVLSEHGTILQLKQVVDTDECWEDPESIHHLLCSFLEASPAKDFITVPANLLEHRDEMVQALELADLLCDFASAWPHTEEPPVESCPDQTASPSAGQA